MEFIAEKTLSATEVVQEYAAKDILRFITCGSVDDGKSTLIGRLLFETDSLYEDQIQAGIEASKRYGTQGAKLDFALLVDGLVSEREQGITIDVAHIYFSTRKRNYIVADTPGHEQYTRNMVTGASNADTAVLIIDASKGLKTQTKRHSYLMGLMGINRVIVAINKMDLVGYSEEVFDSIREEFNNFHTKVAISQVDYLPISALNGDNLVTLSDKMPWYKGLSLLDILDTYSPKVIEDLKKPFRMPVQWVNRPNSSFRGYAGSLISGSVSVGDRVRIYPSGVESSIQAIYTFDGYKQKAQCDESVTLLLNTDVDVSRGDLICEINTPVEASDQFEVNVTWMSEQALMPGRNYLIKFGSLTVNGMITLIKHKVDVNTLTTLSAKVLELNEIAVCNLSLDRNVPFEPYSSNRSLGGFIFIDRSTNQTVGAGVINFALRRSRNIHLQHIAIDKKLRSTLKKQKPCVLWLTGLSGAGKSTIANTLEQRLYQEGYHTYLLDGDNLRHGLNRDLGFTDEDRVENIRRAIEVSRLMVDAGLIVISSFISPFKSEREVARSKFEHGEFFEIFVDVTLSEAERRDPKGLYRKARLGELKNFTGIDSIYEKPLCADLTLNTMILSPNESVNKIMAMLYSEGVLSDE
ncbi:sulfate adenylyltransferase subunit CysN [Nitrincola tapanii]|uniref:Adenylyl-sulfate kinase n=1 Tax=Nitrincola tapanii TaxID=1708751 RepID=A0A5A9W1D5_9GAMM|nr:sulfate adenylyltransferase subunit CysN [Nitrincola tapanii]KAA0874382.1 sulfate adenylyltransferase subunit CysN [Nitrincola tapanii]